MSEEEEDVETVSEHSNHVADVNNDNEKLSWASEQ